MIFVDTKIAGAVLIRPERLADERGFFARTFCTRELGEHGLDARVVQGSVSWNQRRGTLRGMHLQTAPHRENKLVSCDRGALYDVILDLRPESATYRTWQAFTLTAESLETLFIPGGCAHGFMTLEDNTLVHYDISEFFAPEAARGIRFDDPAFGIEWPQAPAVISARDLAFPPYTEGLDRP